MSEKKQSEWPGLSTDAVLLDRCQSPIEKTMVAGLAVQIHKSFDLEFEFRTTCDHPAVIGYWPSRLMVLAAQVLFGKYRADIIIGQLFKHGLQYPWALVIECDGHEYHERTKAQAARDRRRDRWMLERGLTVVRFTGSEIHNDPVGCVFEAFDHALRLQNDWMRSVLQPPNVTRQM